jgi:hypothetical protein
MLYHSGGRLGHDVHRGYMCFDSENHDINVLSPRKRTLTRLLYLELKLNTAERRNTRYVYDLEIGRM